jgi:hypothetical protein
MNTIKLDHRLVTTFIGIVDDADRPRSHRIPDAIEPRDEDETAGYPLALR